MAPPKGAKKPAEPKKNVAAISAIKTMMAARQAAEDEFRRQQEEALRLQQEEERQLEAERLKVEEVKRKKKEREVAKKEDLKKQGKLMTKAEKERAQMNKLKLEQLLQQSGGIKAMAAEESEEGGEKKKRPIYTDKKRKHKDKVSDAAGTDNSEKITAKEMEAVAAEDDVVDDWESALLTSSESDAEDTGSKSKASSSKVSSSPEKLDGSHAVRQNEKALDALSLKAGEKGPVGFEKGPAGSEKDPAGSEKDPVGSEKELRSPICCILGHVDTGKTKLLDKIRQTNVQEGEAGGITQQIGATYFPIDIIKEKTLCITREKGFDYRVPGLLVIDTPGHESFTNLRTRGSSLCNIAILVVDIMHGLEPQTLESIGLLRQRKTPFIVALNKIDRLYGWKTLPELSFEASLAQQTANVRKEFDDRLGKTILAFAEQGLNAELFCRNADVRKFVSLVPTSAITGDGIPDMLMLLIQLTQKMMSESLLYLSTLQCTVLEVKVIEGLGTTIDVILSNGVLKEGSRIVVCGLNGPIVTTIRALLTPQPLRELRIKSQYVHHKQVKAALGVKICAPDLEKAVAGSQLLVIEDGQDEDAIVDSVMEDLTQMLNSVDKTGRGVCVQASTLGSLEALLAFLKDSSIPVAGISIGPVYKKDVTRASVMLESAKEFAVILAFDVKIDKEALELAEELDVTIFKADIIYHLFDQFTAYMNNIREQKKKDLAPQAVFPCVLRIVPGCVFNKREPIIVGVDVVEGILRIGTPICVPAQGGVTLGRVSSIEVNHKPVEQVRKGGPSVAIKIENASYESPKTYGRHFTELDDLVSKISRSSIDILKENFRNDLSKDDWQLVVKLKKVLGIP